MNQFRFQQMYLSAFAQNAGWFLFWGVLLAVLGVVAVSAATFTTLLSVVILGFFIFCGGCVMLLDTITFWRKASSFIINLIFSLLYLAVGLILITNPEEASVSLTLLIGVFLLIAGIFRLALSVLIRMPRWGWGFLNGIVTLLLGFLILNNWPESSLFIIGLFVGIDLFFIGWFYIMAALAAKSLK